VDETGITYFLRTGGVLSPTAGTSNAYVDAQVNSSQACSAANPTGRAFTSLGTWTAAPVQSASQ
jgi:hypothetical protein